MLFVAGIVLLALGLLSGVSLVLFALDVIAGSPGLALWILFPAFTIMGYLMAAAPSHDSMLPMLSRATGALLIVLALASAIALVMQGSGLLQPGDSEDATALWYVLVVGIVLGATGLGSHRRDAGGEKPAA
jgi:hypothetical protein